MTNVSAIKIYEGRDRQSQNVVMVADSMSTQIGGHQKEDDSQKLFNINGSLAMHSGARDYAIEIYNEIRKSGVSGASNITKAILDASNRMGLPPKVPLDFIVSGFENGAARLFYINSTGFNPVNPESSEVSGRGASEQPIYALSGSGQPFAERVIGGQIDLGIDPRPRDVTSGLSLVKTIAEAATGSIGVNDRLQYGVVTPEGCSTLFHPLIGMLDPQERKRYAKDITGMDIVEVEDFGDISHVKAMNHNRPGLILTRDFYNAFDLDMSLLGRSSKNFRTVADLFKENRADIKELEERKEIYQRDKINAEKAVKALLSKNPIKIREYLKQERERRESQYPILD